MIISASGAVAIGHTSPTNGLTLDIAGKVGADEYCDSEGLHCFTPNNLPGATSDIRHPVVFSANFTNGGSLGQRPLSYKIGADGRLLIHGDTKRLVDGAGNLVFTLPAGYRPAYRTQGTLLASRSEGISAVYDIEQDGKVSVYRPTGFSGNYVAFNVSVPLE